MSPNAVHLVLLLSCVGVVVGSQILMLVPLGSKSHFTSFDYVAQGLAAKGHKITIYSIYPSSKPSANVKEYNIMQDNMMKTKEISEWMKNVFQPRSTFKEFFNFKVFTTMACENMFSHPDIKALIEEVKVKGRIYDVAFVNAFFSECSIPLASIAAKHIILIASIPLPHWIALNFNIPSPTSNVPSVFAEYVPPMNFYQRLINTVGAYFMYGLYKFQITPEMQSITDKHLPQGTPKIFEAMKNVSFIFTNSDPVYTVPRPLMPFVADIGGIHLKEANPLPKDLEDYVQSSGKDGVIMFGFGSAVEARYLPKNIRDAFITALSKLKQKVIWKFEEQIEGLPANIKIVKWMPQQDLLANPKVRLFISHSGRLSLQEATYHGVPIIGIPLFGDQPHNINLAKEHGFAEKLAITNITADSVYSLIMKVLSDNRYTEKAKEASAIMKDRLTNPLDRAVYWTEYVIRHNGAHHLKNKGAQEQCFVQTLLLDVFAVMGLIATAVIGISISIIVFSCKFISRKFLKKTKQKKN